MQGWYYWVIYIEEKVKKVYLYLQYNVHFIMAVQYTAIEKPIITFGVAYCGRLLTKDISI